MDFLRLLQFSHRGRKRAVSPNRKEGDTSALKLNELSRFLALHWVEICPSSPTCVAIKLKKAYAKIAALGKIKRLVPSDEMISFYNA